MPWEQQLRHDFEARDGSFMLQLRVDLRWDRNAFSSLIQAMKLCAEAHQESDSLPRWIAEGFWYLSTFVREWSTHPDFPRLFEESYYESAYQRLDDLAYWLFRGESPYTPDTTWESL